MAPGIPLRVEAHTNLLHVRNNNHEGPFRNVYLVYSRRSDLLKVSHNARSWLTVFNSLYIPYTNTSNTFMQSGFNDVNMSNILYYKITRRPNNSFRVYQNAYDLGTCVARTGLEFGEYPTPHIHLILWFAFWRCETKLHVYKLNHLLFMSHGAIIHDLMVVRLHINAFAQIRI